MDECSEVKVLSTSVAWESTGIGEWCLVLGLCEEQEVTAAFMPWIAMQAMFCIALSL